MIKLSKTAAVLVGFILVAVGMSLWAQQPDESSPRRRARPRPERATQPVPKAPAKKQARPAYVVEPPDLLVVEVLEALPGRTISGERLVRPDGCISLGFYGDIPVAGLTIPEIKEKIVLHLRKFIEDEILGLVETEPDTGKVLKETPARDTDRVFVDVSAYNSAVSYVEGDVVTPGRIPYTGGNNVLDLIHYSGGLLPSADQTKIRLVRSFPKGSPARVLPVDYEEITMGTDSSTNYSILPNDRLVVPHDRSYMPERDSDEDYPSQPRSPEGSDRPGRSERDDPGTEKSVYFGRQPSPPRQVEQPNELEQRVSKIESKLDRLIELMEGDRVPTGEPPLVPKPSSMEEPDVRRVVPEVPVARNPFDTEEPDVRGMEPPRARERSDRRESWTVAPPRAPRTSQAVPRWAALALGASHSAQTIPRWGTASREGGAFLRTASATEPSASAIPFRQRADVTLSRDEDPEAQAGTLVIVPATRYSGAGRAMAPFRVGPSAHDRTEPIRL